MSDISKSDCCGNGCANCILDTKPLSSKRLSSTNKKNILHTYYKYKLIEKNHLNNLPNILRLKFNISSDKKQLTDFILDCPPGHHLMMRAPTTAAAGNFILRPYSPFWTDATEFQFEILVNLKPQGQMTKFIQKLKLHDEVEVRGPIGAFMHEPSVNSEAALLIFCQGVAIAPTIPIVQNIITNETDNCKIFHFSCFQNIENIIFREKLMEFKRFWNFSSKIYLSKQVCSVCVGKNNAGCEHFKRLLKYKEQVNAHRLTMDDIRSNLEGIKSVRKQFVVCGSQRFQEFIENCLLKCGVSKSAIFIT